MQEHVCEHATAVLMIRSKVYRTAGTCTITGGRAAAVWTTAAWPAGSRFQLTTSIFSSHTHTQTIPSQHDRERLANKRRIYQVERVKKGNTKAFLDEHQPVMTSGRALNCLEACAAQQAPSSHPVSRSDQNRHGAAAQPALTPPGKSKVKPGRTDCYVRAEIVQIPSPSSLGLTRSRSD